MDNADWTKLCDIDFVKKFNSPKPLQHFRRLAYFRRQGSNTIKAIENLKIKEAIQWEESQDSLDPASNDLYKSYSAKQWEAVHDLFQSLGFSDIDDTKILLGDDVSKAFKQTRKKIIKIREDALLLFGFKSRAKETPNLKATVKLINAIARNWCSYTVKSEAKLSGPKNQTGFNKAGTPILPPYKPEEPEVQCSSLSANYIQELFDSISVADTNSNLPINSVYQ
ncbi:28869_t:CDS:2 [Gigaspora margarita]|uniref:28869_t:CDS:1 n=1 Tax=Gigaspora margarita TaxID=4874 RepID=A0ABN7VLJ9_GIGMA|nr:28869_t:CDS:2 [Gigaspora margarita]